MGPLNAGGTEADQASLPLATERFLLGDSARGPHGPEPPSCDTPAPHGDVGGLYGGSGPKRFTMCPERCRALFRHADTAAERVATAADWHRNPRLAANERSLHYLNVSISPPLAAGLAASSSVSNNERQ